MTKIIVNGVEKEPCKVVKLYKEVGAKETDKILLAKKKDMGYKSVKKSVKKPPE